MRKTIYPTPWLGRFSLSGQLEPDMPARNSQFSKRQSEILKLVSEGKTDKEIASDLGIAEETVGSHLRVVFSRLRVRSRIQAVLRWKRL